LKKWVIVLMAAVLVQSVVIADALDNNPKIHSELSRQIVMSQSNNSEDMIRVIVIMKEQYQAPQVKVQGHVDQKQHRMDTVNSLKQKSGRSQQNLISVLQGKGADKMKNARLLWIVNAITFEATPDVIEELANRDDVAQVIPDYEVHLVEESVVVGDVDVLAATAWGVEKINAPQVWDFIYNGTNINGTGVNVSIIDTGINYSHPDLASNYIGGYDFVNDDNDPMDDDGHGTHVAGTVAGTGVGGKKTGVAPGSNIFGVKVLNADGNGSYSDLIDGVQWSIDNGADIVSLSLGGPNDSSMTTMVNNVIDAGVLPVIAAGNDGPGVSTIKCPGDEFNATTVGSTDSSDTIAPSSSRGPVTLMGDTYIKPDLTAPGVNIESTSYHGGYYIKSGTSMATPHVSGAAALILQAYPDMSPLEVRQLLEDTAVDLGTAGKDNTYGSGRIDVFKAIFPQVSTITITPDLTNINLTINATINDARHNISYADFYIDADTANATLLTAIDSNFNETSENVTGSIDITNLSDGIYTITIRTNNNLDIWNNQTKTSFTIDTTAPHITLHSLDNNSAIQNGTIIDFTITDLSLANVSYSINSTQQGYSNITNVTLPHPYEINTTDWNESTYVIRIWANDSLGHENSTHYRFTIDDTPPKITGVFHNASGILDQGDILGINMVGDPGISNATFNVNGLVYDQPMDEIASGNYSGNYTVDGIIEIKDAIVTGYLTDEAGNINSSDGPTINIDTNKPRISLLPPANNSHIQNGTMINLTITDIFLVNVIYNYYGTDLPLLSPFDINSTGWNEGQYDITIWANDSLNHISSAIYNITIDDTAPNLTIISPTSGYKTTISTVNISGMTDEDAELTINNESVTLINGSFSEYRSLVNGENNFIINATDQAGNINSILRTVTKYTTASKTSGGGGGGGTSGEDFYNIAETETRRVSIFKGENVSYSFENTQNPILNIKFTSKVSAGKVASKIELLRNTSTMVDTPPPGKIYQNINIWVGNYGWATEKNIEDMTISFTVPLDWINSNNIDQGSIALYRYNDDSWEQLPTSLTTRNENSITFTSSTPGFSPFAISGETVFTPAVIPTAYHTPAPVATHSSNITSSSQTNEIEPGGKAGTIMLWVLFIIVIMAVTVIIYWKKDEILLGINNMRQQRGR
jgi:PGF-pre-PGF domain-containing protein